MNYLNIFWKSVQSYPTVQSNPTLPELAIYIFIFIINEFSKTLLSLPIYGIYAKCSVITLIIMFVVKTHHKAQLEVVIFSSHLLKVVVKIHCFSSQGMLQKSGNKFLTTRFFHQVVEKGS